MVRTDTVRTANNHFIQMENNDNIQGINEFDFNLICEYFSSTERQGPGSDEATLMALSMIGTLPQSAKVVDLGCGTGSSALILARKLGVEVTALDLFPQFIDILRQRAAKAGVADKIRGVVGSMEELPFAPQSLDLVWCEGAIYNIGFERGMNEWSRRLKSGGYIAVTEPTWLTNERPQEITDFWYEAYSEVETMPAKIQKMMNAGFAPVSAFVLPSECWTTNFYVPQRPAQELFLQRHADNQFATELVKNQRHEALMYERYNQYYGYVFYIGRKL